MDHYDNEYDEVDIPCSDKMKDVDENDVDDAIYKLFKALVDTLEFDYFYDGVSVIANESISFNSFDQFVYELFERFVRAS